MGEIEYKDDYELVHKYLCDDINAGERLYSKIYMPIHKYIASRTVSDGYNEDDREDIFSKVMYTSVEKLEMYNGQSSFLTFVCGIANNAIREYRRKKYKDSKILSLDELQQSEDEQEELSFYTNTPEQYVLRKEVQEQVRTVLNSMSADYRDIIKLRIMNGLPYKTISALSQESVEALESRFRRATVDFIKRLKKI